MHLSQLNKEYTTQTVFYLLISFRHLFIILICIFNHYNLIQFIRASCLQNDCWRHISTISVNYIQGKCQLRDTRLNVQSPFARLRIPTSHFGIFKDWIKSFLIALSIDNQWPVEWHTWYPYKTNQFHVQHDFLFSSKRPVLVRMWQKNLFQRSQILIIVDKCYLRKVFW